MTGEELAAEREVLTVALRGYRPYPAVAEAREASAALLDTELGNRAAAEFEARLPVLQMADEDLTAEGAELTKIRFNYRDIPVGAREAYEARAMAVGTEMADRHLRSWESQQTPVGELDDIQLSEAIEAFGEQVPHDAFAGHYRSRQRVEDARGARLKVLRAEQTGRDERRSGSCSGRTGGSGTGAGPRPRGGRRMSSSTSTAAGSVICRARTRSRKSTTPPFPTRKRWRSSPATRT